MLSTLLGLNQLVIQQIANEGFVTRLAYGLGFLALAAILTSLWLNLRLRKLQAEMGAQKDELSSAEGSKNEFRTKAKDFEKEIEKRKNEISELKNKLGKQKRKVHDLQEAHKKSEKSWQDDKQKLEGALTQKVAFNESAKTPEPVQPKAVIPKVPVEQEKKADDSELRKEEALKLKRQISSLEEQLHQERDQVKAYKRDMRQAARRMEGFRRIDILTKNKLELAEDKLAQLGRDYYDAISELAALKGEVVPPTLVKPSLPEREAFSETSEELSSPEDILEEEDKGLVDFKSSAEQALAEDDIDLEESVGELAAQEVAENTTEPPAEALES